MKVCNVSGCPALIRQSGRCDEHKRKAEQRRGTATERGYGAEHRKRFREGVLSRNPVCVLCLSAPASVADHWPLSKRELIEQGMDDNDPQHGRGLCHPCHSKETSRLQPGGWHENAR